jgi:Holliday junction DNA helicase RuvA
MIGQITGILLDKKPPQLLVDVSGIGYEIEASMHTFYKLPEIGQKIILHTHFIVREDAHLLFGFFEDAERSLFRTLIKVNGVGPKLAMTILSSVTPDEFIGHIIEKNAVSLTRVPGVGKKTAERLIIEMQDKLKDWDKKEDLTLPLLNTNSTKLAEQEAVSALIALGYKPQEASRAVNQIRQDDATSEELIRLALRNMVK